MYNKFPEKAGNPESKFSELIIEDGDKELEVFLKKYNFTLNKVMKLDDAMNNANVNLSNTRGKSLFNNHKEYINLKEMYKELLKLKLKLKKEKKKNIKVDMYLNYLKQFLYKSQTGDVLSQRITTYTKYGNLVDKIFKQSRGKRKKQKKEKK